MNLDELQSVQSRERQASSLQHLRASFYEEAGEYVGELRRERNRTAAAADDPFDSPEVERLTDDIRTAERTVESIYERRVGKVVKLASIAAADMPYDDDGLTNEEERLFDELVDAIEHNRECVLSVLDGEAPSLDCTPVEESDSTETDGSTAIGSTDDPISTPADASDSSVGPDPTPRADPTPTETDPEPASATDQRPATPDEPTTAGTEPSAATDHRADEPAGTAVDVTDDGLDIGGAMGGGGRNDGDPEPTRRTEADEPAGPVTSGAPDVPDAPASESTVSDTAGSAPETLASTGDERDSVDEGTDPVERTMVRVTADVGEVFGVDGRSYDLSAEDVVTLPTPNADGLVSKNAAERLD